MAGKMTRGTSNGFGKSASFDFVKPSPKIGSPSKAEMSKMQIMGLFSDGDSQRLVLADRTLREIVLTGKQRGLVFRLTTETNLQAVSTEVNRILNGAYGDCDYEHCAAPQHPCKCIQQLDRMGAFINSLPEPDKPAWFKVFNLTFTHKKSTPFTMCPRSVQICAYDHLMQSSNRSSRWNISYPWTTYTTDMEACLEPGFPDIGYMLQGVDTDVETNAELSVPISPLVSTYQDDGIWKAAVFVPQKFDSHARINIKQFFSTTLFSTTLTGADKSRTQILAGQPYNMSTHRYGKHGWVVEKVVTGTRAQARFPSSRDYHLKIMPSHSVSFTDNGVAKLVPHESLSSIRL